MTHPPSDLEGPDPATAAEEARLAISTAGLAIPTLRAPGRSHHRTRFPPDGGCMLRQPFLVPQPFLERRLFPIAGRCSYGLSSSDLEWFVDRCAVKAL